MKLIKHFESFLDDTVNLNKTRYDTASSGIDGITTFLKSNGVLKNYFVDTSPQGSYKQKTIIRPVSEEFEFDVDLLFELKRIEGWEAKDYLINVANELKHTDRYKDKVDTKNKSRCVTIDYESDFHIDLIPAVKTDNGHWIMNKNTNEFEMTDGDGYAQWFENQTVITNGFLVETVRLVKYLRDSKELFEVKSILLTTLLGNQVYYATDTFEKFPDLPTTLRLLLYRLDQYLLANSNMPTVSNPTLPEESFNRHWNQEKYSKFKGAVHNLYIKINDAYLEPDQEQSIKKWQTVFGDDFPSMISELEVVNFTLGDITHAQPLKWGHRNLNKVRIDAYVYTGNTKGAISKLGGLNSDGRLLQEGLRLLYKAKTNTKQPYEVEWQVVNTGPHAASDDGLRGDFFRGKFTNNKPTQDPLNNWETTKYTGKHWIECFIIKDGICVARSGKFFVNIKNAQY